MENNSFDEKSDLEFDFNEFLKKYQNDNPLILNYYFKDIYRELSNNNEGISFESFREYVNLPKFISKHLFRIISNCKEKISNKDFLINMNHLYEGSFLQLIKFIFNFIDFDNDGSINLYDVRQILILSLNSENQNDSIFNYIDKNVNMFFGDSKIMNLQKFQNLTENYNSDIFINLVTYLYENKPFTNQVISYYFSDKRLANSDLIKKPKEELNIERSKTIEENMTIRNKEIRDNYKSEIEKKSSMSDDKLHSHLYFDRKINNLNNLEKIIDKKAIIKSPNTNLYLNNDNYEKLRKVATYTNVNKIIEEEDIDEDMEFPTDELEDYEYINVPVFPKIKNTFFPVEKISSRSNISPKIKSVKIESKFSLSDIIRRKEEEKIETKEITKFNCQLKRCATKPLKRNNIQHLYNISDDSLFDKSKTIENNLNISIPFIPKKKFTYESHINKFDKKKEKIIKYYIVLNQRMMLYFKDEKKTKYRGLHYLSDITTEVIYNKKESIFLKGEKYYYLVLLIKEQKKYFVSTSEFEIRKWFELFKKTINPHKSRNLKEYYNLKETLSEGKYGLVKRAINIKTKEVVSIKIIGRKISLDENELNRVRQEIEILMHCNHCGIVRYIDYFEEYNKEKNTHVLYIVMEHLSGGDLASHIIKNGPLPEKKVISLIWNIAKSMEYLHKLGIVHRDIKPENIVLDVKNKPKIVDFGLSIILTYDEYLKDSYGTFYYASPEIHNKIKYTKSTDIWSFGVLIYFIITGNFPFSKKKEKALLVISDLEKELDFDNYDFMICSDELKNLVKKCLKKKFKNRIDISQIVNDPLFEKYNDSL